MSTKRFLSKLTDHVTALRWRPFVEHYGEVPFECHVHLSLEPRRVKVALGEHRYLCAVFVSTTGLYPLHGLEAKAIGRAPIEPDSVKASEDVGVPMLAEVVEFGQNPKRVVWVSEGLQFLHECSGLSSNALQHRRCATSALPLALELQLVQVDGKRRSAQGITEGNRARFEALALPDGQFVDQVVEGGPEVMDRIPDAMRELIEDFRIGRRRRPTNLYGLLATRTRVRLGAEHPTLRLLEPLDTLARFADVVLRPLELVRPSASALDTLATLRV